ncbi:acyl-CoA dehydratase activase, partial [Chloroflexota bacterium]
MCKIQSLGIDLGSTSAKIVAVDDHGRMSWHVLEPTSPYVEDQVEGFLTQARQQIGSLEGIPLIATGYNRRRVPQATNHITEITCHARGIFREMQHGGTLIDIGGQDSKCIRINPDGKVIDFAMNDKCAAGTGRFLENIAQRLGLPLEKIGEIALGASEEASISSTCT